MLGNHVILQLKYNEKLDFTELPSFSSKPTYNSIFNSVNSWSSVTILFFLWTSPPIWQVVTCKCNRHLQTPVNLEYPLEYESATELSEKSKIYVKKMTCTSARVYHSCCGMVQREMLIFQVVGMPDQHRLSTCTLLGPPALCEYSFIFLAGE